eukprot:jgi/Chlat1/3532/Chrsp23S03710
MVTGGEAPAVPSPITTSLSAPVSLQAPPRTPRTPMDDRTPLETYLRWCAQFQVQPDGGAVVALRFNLPELKPANPRNFGSQHLLALSEAVHTSLDALSNLTSINLHRCPVGNSGAVPLAHVLSLRPSVRALNLASAGIGASGVRALAALLAKDTCSLRILNLRHNVLRYEGATMLAAGIKANRSLTLVDVSANKLGVKGVRVIRAAVLVSEATETEEASPVVRPVSFKLRRRRVQARRISVECEGNYTTVEIANSISHGVGLVLSIIGAVLLLRKASHFSARHVASCAIYSATLCILYTSSMLYHSFFTFQRTKKVFRVMDHCSIYGLIAGTYTPVLLILLQDEGFWPVMLLAVVWAIGAFGVLLATTFKHNRYYMPIATISYVVMGWTCLFAIRAMFARLSHEGALMLVLGGLAYTGGVPFVALDGWQPSFHAIWHCFVLAGSVFHYILVYRYVLPAVPLHHVVNTGSPLPA